MPYMNIREYLQRIADGYTTNLSLDSEGHRLLRAASEVFKPFLPGGLRVQGSGGKGRPTFTPWIGILDYDEAPTPRSGIYLVWIFSNDLSEVVLTLNQGITQLAEEKGFSACLPILATSAQRIRRGLSCDLDGLEAEVDFGPQKRQRGYAAANIVAKRYYLDHLPEEAELLADMRRMVQIYQESVAVKRRLLTTSPGSVLTGSPLRIPEPGESEQEFKPKDRGDYLVMIAATEQWRRADRHELLLSEYAAIAKKQGHRPRNVNVHPRDLTLNVSGEEWLVEAKVIYNGNVPQAVRAAIGQLAEYSYLLYDKSDMPRLMTLFSEPIGPLYIGVLERLDIAAVWKGEGGWEGSDLASAAGLI